MKAIIVTRFSDESQRGNTSTEVQEEACRNYCATHGYEVVGIKKFEAQSAKQSNTKRVAMLLDFCRKYKGKADVLCIYKFDRFARSVDLHIYLRSELLKMNMTAVSATEPIDNSPAGKLTEHMLAAIAQFDNDQKAERVGSAMKNKCEHGIWPWKAPLGYINVRDINDKADAAAIDEEMAPHIRNIFNWYGTGQMGVVEISNEMQKHVFTHKKGKHKGKRIRFSPQTIHTMLTNKFYIGILDVKSWNEQFDGSHKPLIDVKTWEACQARINPLPEIKMTRKRINPDFPLKDNLWCGHCNRKMTAAWTQGKMQKFAYYYCTHSDCSNPGQKAIGKNQFENEFFDYLNMLQPEPELKQSIHDRLLVRYQQRKDEFETDASRQRKQLEALEKQKQNLVNALANGADKDDILPAINKIKQDIALVKLSLNESHTGEFEMDLMLTYADKFFSRMALLWSDAPLQQKIQLQRVLFPEGIVYSNNAGFSNTKLRPYISLLWEAKQSPSINVTPRGIEPRLPG